MAAAVATVKLYSAEDLKEVEGVWPYPASNDGWVHSHNALRLDMADFARCLAAVAGRLEAGGVLPAWQVETMNRWFARFVRSVHEHHDHEERLFFPEMVKKCELPPKMSGDHPSLMAALEGCAQRAQALRSLKGPAEALDAVRGLQAAFLKLEEDMLAHFAEEEDVGLKLWRRNFTPKTAKPVIKKLIASLTMEDNAQFLRPMSREQVKAWGRQEGIPGPVVSWLFFPAMKKYDGRYTQPLEDVTRGEQSAPQRSRWACFAA